MIAPRRLRTRLFVAMVGLAGAVLLASALAAAALARETTADSARRDLERQAPPVAAELEQVTTLAGEARIPVQARRLSRFLGRVLAVADGSLVVVDADGAVRADPSPVFGRPALRRASSEALGFPDGLEASDLDPARLAAGTRQSGRHGSTVFVAQPLAPVAGATPVLILTRDVETRPLGRAGPYLLLTGAVALVVAAAVAALLARRLTRPIAAMEAAAARIAAGDLSARVELGPQPDDELASLARALDAMAADLERAKGAERAFLLGVSHDLRTPLTSIRGYAEAIADGTVASDLERRRAAAVISAESRRLERLVADLLDLARLDTHRFSLTPRPVDARAVVEQAVAGFLPAARDWGLSLEVAPGPPVALDADPERLAQIVANLVENALSHARSTVTVAVARADGGVELRVDDDGPGIPAEERTRVFERLYTARDGAGRRVGTGIGLAIVHELAAAMGGAAACRPLDGQGTRFEVTIPA